MNLQDRVYLESEANAFFERCVAAGIKLDSDQIRSSKKTIYTNLLSSIGEKISGISVLEVGCFIGDLLASLKHNHGCQVVGIEPSSLACEFAAKTFQLNISNNIFIESNYFGCTSDNFSAFDLVILDDVLSWMPRETLLPVLGSIDWLLKSGGHLYIRDFCPPVDFAYPNHHQKEKEVYNYKVSNGHKKFFLNTGNYVIETEYIRNTEIFQKVVTSRPDSMIWSDVILRKTTEPIQPRLDMSL